jgi:predicted membrane chloride channel (bestrophin family)
MVVEYPSSARGSATSFFLYAPRLIFWYKGSTIPNVLPQALIAQALAYAAYQNKELYEVGGKFNFGGITILVAFLLIFKTQTAYKQYWTALAEVDGLLQLNRILARGMVTLSDWEKNNGKAYIRRFLRYQVLYYFVLIEHFVRLQDSAEKDEEEDDEKNLDTMRKDIEQFCSPEEFALLYPNAKKGTKGSKTRRGTKKKMDVKGKGKEIKVANSSPYAFLNILIPSRFSFSFHRDSHDDEDDPIPLVRSANPLIVLHWMQCILREGVNDGDSKAGFFRPQSVFNLMINGLSGLEKHFWTMEKIDNLQFPLPYAQVVKILVVIYVFTFPFTIAEACGVFTLPITFLVSIGFFGLDEVAEILESPFSTDPNSINLRAYSERLIRDLDTLFYMHEKMKNVALSLDNNTFFNAAKETLLDRFADSGKETGRKLMRSQTRSFTNLQSKDSKKGFTDGAAAAYDSSGPPLRTAAAAGNPPLPGAARDYDDEEHGLDDDDPGDLL